MSVGCFLLVRITDGEAWGLVGEIVGVMLVMILQMRESHIRLNRQGNGMVHLGQKF